ncbi:MAG: copper homeostasis protein CutC [Bacteroidales bacterium]|nr:copper homeostasis protein CutC [Candidatus Cryptobacteroides choladohippi]
MARLLEACCTSAAEARTALEGGAGRIELCEEIAIGGVTPSEANIAETVALGLPVNVLVRPRGGNFVFNEEEERQMLRSIDACRRLGAAGVVIGALKEDGSIDLPMMGRLVSRARGNGSERRLSVTFHRAFDECAEPFAALDQIIALGCDRLLTSGQKPSAYEGMELIAELVKRADGRIIIMPGAGITPANLDIIENETGAVEFHGTRICHSEQSV